MQFSAYRPLQIHINNVPIVHINLTPMIKHYCHVSIWLTANGILFPIEGLLNYVMKNCVDKKKATLLLLWGFVSDLGSGATAWGVTEGVLDRAGVYNLAQNKTLAYTPAGPNQQ
jgi:hypothetical protein